MIRKMKLKLKAIVSLFIKSNKHISIIDKIWDGSLQEKDDLALISSYHDELLKKNNPIFVDSTTWSDLNMDEVYFKINRCTSSVGKQYLYHLLHRYDIPPNSFNNTLSTYKYFTDNSQIRRKFQNILLQSNQTSAYFISKLLFSRIPPKPNSSVLIYLTSFLLFFTIMMTIFIHQFILVALGLSIINILIHNKLTPKIFSFLPDMYSLRMLLKIADQLSKFDEPILQIKNLKEHRSIIDKVSKKSSWLLIDITKLDEFSASIMQYLNIFFLLNIIAYLNSIDTIRRAQNELLDVFEQIASLDVTISMASYINSLTTYCIPKFNHDNAIHFKNVYHPLLKEPVANSFNLENTSCLITGSNMAGKTTFIKTIGINIILSQNLGICLAESANIPRVNIKSSINRQEDLSQNQSYYFKEIEAILQFIKYSDKDYNYCFLIDEMFRGTNTLERLSASTAVLDFLSDKNIILVTTHDIELQELLNGKFDIYHFNEQLDNNVHYFDYKIKHGPCSTRNAIRLLDLKGYPKTIIEKALKYCEKLSTTKMV
jgi:hypothetical protein